MSTLNVTVHLTFWQKKVKPDWLIFAILFSMRSKLNNHSMLYQSFKHSTTPICRCSVSFGTKSLECAHAKLSIQDWFRIL